MCCPNDSSNSLKSALRCMAMIKALIRIGRMECLPTSIFLKGGSRTIQVFGSGCPGKVAGSGAHLEREHSHPSVATSSEKKHVLRNGTTSLLRAGQETLTLKPLIDRPLQESSSHNFPDCSQPLKSSNVVPRESYEHAHRNRPTRASFLKPLRYDGKLGSVESHLTQFAIVAQRNHWDDGEKADYLMCSLTGEASNILKDLPENPSYEDVVACLRQHYGSVDQVEAYRAQLKNRRRRPGESLQDLMKDIRRIFLSAYPGPTNYMSEIALKDAFITALVDRDLVIKTMEREPKTLDEAYKVAERMELYRFIPETSEGDTKSKFQPKVRGTAADDGVLKSLVETQRVIQRQLASLQECVKQPPPQATPSPSARGPRVSRPNMVCHHCQSPGRTLDPIARTSPFVRILLVETEIEGLTKVQDRRRVLGQPIQFAQSERLYI